MVEGFRFGVRFRTSFTGPSDPRIPVGFQVWGVWFVVCCVLCVVCCLVFGVQVYGLGLGVEGLRFSSALASLAPPIPGYLWGLRFSVMG